MRIQALITLLFCYTLAQAEQLQLTILYEDVANPPYALTQGSMTPSANAGITIDILRKVAKKLDLNIAFERKTWSQGTQLLKHGRIDGLFHGSFKAERLKIAQYPMLNGKPDRSRRLMTQSYYLYAPANQKPSWNGKDLNTIKVIVGAPLGYSIVSDLKANNVDILETKQLMQAMLMLKNNRLEAVASLEHMGDALLKKHPEQLKEIQKHQPALKQKDYYLLLSRQFVDKHPLVAEAIWSEIGRIRESNEWKQIVGKYMHQ